MIPVYPFPRHPEVYRRLGVMYDRARWLRDQFGKPVTLASDSAPRTGVPSAMFAANPLESDSLTLLGAVPLLPTQSPNGNVHLRTDTLAALVPLALTSRFLNETRPNGYAAPYEDSRYVQVVGTTTYSGLSGGAPYWAYSTNITIPVTEDPDPEEPQLTVVTVSYPTFFTVSRITRFEGQHQRLAYDGVVHWDGQASADFDLLQDWFEKSYWIAKSIMDSAHYAAQVNAYIAANPQIFDGLTMYQFSDASPIPDPNVYAEGMQSVTRSVRRDVSGGPWIHMGTLHLVGIDQYRYNALGGPTYSGVVLDEQTGYVLLEDGDLWKHDLEDGTRELVASDVWYFERGQLDKFYKADGTEGDLT